MSPPIPPDATPVYLVACPLPGCGGRVRAERGRSVEWIYCCDRHGAAFDDLAEGYGEAKATLYEGPSECKVIRWQRHRSQLLAPEPRPTLNQYKRWRSDLLRNPEALDYIRDERGLSDETIARHLLGYGRPNDARPSGFILPQPIGNAPPKSYRLRFWPDPWLTNGRAVKIITPRHHRAQIYPRLPGPFETAGVLVEGELDCLLLRQNGFNAYSTPGIMIRDALALRLGRSLDKVAVVFDVGPNAQAAANRAVGMLADAGSKAWRVDLALPHDGEDVTDWFMTYRRSADELRDLINTRYRGSSRRRSTRKAA
ncbi:MAG TPA: hypothetical protein VG294_00415 [Solirubrobacteraceae bacterium]|jgi:hypothetical protein|nr:hypothetical protein [Solirubrobacteraceae bacterium]